jgi:hypothetical protein
MVAKTCGLTTCRCVLGCRFLLDHHGDVFQSRSKAARDASVRASTKRSNSSWFIPLLSF